MSLPPEDDDLIRRAQIEEMMRSDRERYFRDEPVQQEYRDIVSRMDGQGDEEAESPTSVRTPGRFDIALAQFNARKLASADTVQPETDGMAPSLDTLPDASVGKSDRLPRFQPQGQEQQQTPFDLPDAGEVKGDRLPVMKPETVPLTPAPDPLKAFKTEPPLRFDGKNRVEELQGNQPERPLAIKWGLKNQINYAAAKNGVGVEVRSGGQPPKSQRLPKYQERGPLHDYGNAADVDLYVIEKGKRRYLDSQNLDDRRKMESFIRDAVIAGATGIGHGYMNTAGSFTRRIHVGGGDPIAWKDQIKGRRNLNEPFPWVQAALDQGLAERKKLSPRAWASPAAPIRGLEAGPDGPVDSYSRPFKR